ncbi:acyl-CoA dehydrogenase family protein [Candidatus Fermentibacteria bacterium]|nr:acyl-CoA dehydrogenase family protein [Candidatus Fermentibacteria bacterium]
MGNFFHDNPDIQFQLRRPELDEVILLTESNFRDAEQFSHAPSSVEDARDSYGRVLEIVGAIAADDIAPYAAEVDEAGCVLDRGANRVHYAQPTSHALRRLSQADLMGFTMPRRYGGLNLPCTVYSMAIEIVSRADAALMNLFGLQEISSTINDFADEEIKASYLPRLCSGELTAAMVLTEPDAGSDLQAIRLAASQDPSTGGWYLDGVKRFITNGCGEVLLVLARSEPGTSDGRGLSLFLCDGGDKVRVRRIEEKLGIHGSPTCELEFHHVPAVLIGKRRLGLIRYVMALMNGARLGVACQALGIAEAAYRVARRYAEERVQFKRPVIRFPAVAEMLATMRLGLMVSRALITETSITVDLDRQIRARVEAGDMTLRPRSKKLARQSDFFTPLAKLVATETANKVAYDAMQVLGGAGYMRDFAVERHYRDARITNIYEGTSQLQVVAAVGGITSGVLSDWAADFRAKHDLDDSAAGQSLREAGDLLNRAIASVRDHTDPRFADLHAGRLVTMAADLVGMYLLARDAHRDPGRSRLAELHTQLALPRMEQCLRIVCDGLPGLLGYPEEMVGPLPRENGPKGA